MDHVYLISFEKHHKYFSAIKVFPVMIDRQHPNLFHSITLDHVNLDLMIYENILKQIKAVTSCSTHKIDRQETDG